MKPFLQSFSLAQFSLLAVELLTVSIATSASAKTQQPGPVTNANEGERPKLFVPAYGIDLANFRPASSQTRSVFGSNFTSFSPGLGPVFSMKGRSFAPNLNIVQSNGGGKNKIFQVYLGPEYRYGLVEPIQITPEGPKVQAFAPYLGASINAVYTDISSSTLGVSAKKLGYGASAFVGTTVSKNARVELRYLLSSEVEGIKLSGFSAQIGIRF
jgi:hypothetical protein